MNILIFKDDLDTLVFKFGKISRIADVKVHDYVTTTPHLHVKLIKQVIIITFALHIDEQLFNNEILLQLLTK